MTSALYPADRLARAAAAARDAGLEALLVTPGADLRYLTGYDALPLERLTCLVVRAAGDATLVVPNLEKPRAETSPAGALGIEIVGWDETDDPYALTASIAGPCEAVGVSDRTWALHTLRWADAMPGVLQRLAGTALRDLRIRKTPEEVAALREAGRIIDDVQGQIQEMRLVGREEREVGRDIADAILAGGNVTVNFVIVGSGPNGASPHHDTGPRVIERGDAIVFDIGGTTPDGYCSDITRTYVVGEVPEGFDKLYAVLQQAQEAACDAVRPGVTCEAVDAAARDVIADAGYGEFFVHRTGHGIGLEEHEDPYIVAGNDLPLAPGMAFSIEPGIYLPGRHGARIEDIVVCTEDGADRLNLVTRDLLVLEG
ncbi:MAG TPA: Xaa-Pro peptidase family protein [Mycobacteriales bacterium]|jgi:Xaa-Pro aminopeptidase|nr:Xaa-Pro peptidase family protein [Mycobacteriales bacterium]